MTHRFDATALISATTDLLQKAGLEDRIAHAVADALVQADMLGYSTHGLQFVPAYLTGIKNGSTRLKGTPQVLNEFGGTLHLDADRLPGQWVMKWVLDRVLAIDKTSSDRARLPLQAINIQRSGNISCLAVYVRRAAEAGYLALLMASAPTNSVVTPHGGARGLLSTNPIAYAVPTKVGGKASMILADTSTASSSLRAIERAGRLGEELPADRLIDADGRATTSPNALLKEPRGAILPLGGTEQGHKGFALSLLVEAMTSGLGGFGRAQENQKPGSAYGNNAFLLLVDPSAYGGADELSEEISYLAHTCADMPTQDGHTPPRLPGQRALDAYEQHARHGVALPREVIDLITPHFRHYKADFPAALS